MYVFVYGTLTDPRRVASVVDSYVFVGPAVCEGLRPVEGRYPTLAPGGEVAGRLLRTAEIDALDRYEGVDEGLYVRVSLPYRGSNSAPETVEAYVGDPGRLGVEGVDWPGDGPLAERVARHVEDAGVRVRPGGPTDGRTTRV